MLHKAEIRVKIIIILLIIIIIFLTKHKMYIYTTIWYSTIVLTLI